MFDLLREIAQTLRNNRLRTALTGLAVAWGIFMLIVLLGVARGVTNSFHEQFSNDFSNSIAVWGGQTTMPYAGYNEGRSIDLYDSDMSAIERGNANVSSVTASANFGSATIATAKDYVSGGFDAVYPSAEATESLDMKYGRFINDRDIAEHRRVMVLSAKNARTLFGDDAIAVGQTVKSMDLGWTVVGVCDHRWRSDNYVPYTTYKAITGNSRTTDQLTVTVEGMRTEADGAAAEGSVRQSLAKEHSFNAADKNAVWTWNRFDGYLRGQTANNILGMAVWIIGIFTLLSGIVGVSNIMFVSVRERVHEIGIRRAIGARPRSILTQVLAESVAITTLFGYIGIVLGMVVLQVVDLFTKDVQGFSNPTVDLSMALQVTVALVIAGALAGLFPALKAIKVKPVEALRDE